MSHYSQGIKDSDIFLVILGWHHGDWHAKHSKDCIEACSLNIDNFIILCNDYGDYAIFSDHGFSCALVNQNCFLDYSLFTADKAAKKIYNAVYVGRLTPFKRHDLASDIKNLALVCGNLHGGSSSSYIPSYTYKNDRHLSPEEVHEVICSAHVGLILSEVEGACFASSEYLLCGVPVVSTSSLGGRSIWYNDYNSIVCDASPKDVSQAVSDMIERSPSASRIRNQHITLMHVFRSKFISLLSRIFSLYKIELDPLVYFNENYFHKMRNSLKPNFDTIFGD